MPQLINRDQRSLRGSLRQFLNLQSKTEPGTKYCTGCGSVCMYLPTEFWLDSDEETFSIRLPFCPHCNPDLLSRVPALA